jgi:hypothetical protein
MYARHRYYKIACPATVAFSDKISKAFTFDVCEVSDKKSKVIVRLSEGSNAMS